MPLTEKQIAEIEARWLPLYDVQNRSRLFSFDQYAPADVPALLTALRASQAEARRLRERLASLGVAWHDTVHMSEINPDIEFAHCPKWSCREASAALAPAPEGT